MCVADWSCLAQIPEVGHCLPNTMAMFNGTKNKLYYPYAAYAGYGYGYGYGWLYYLALRGFVEELTEEQRQCLIAAYISNRCEVKKAMLACENVVGEWECLSQIPEVVHCLN
jgi:hypothetical protein